MNPVEIIAIIAIALIIGGAAAYIIKAKLSGKKCIGCPGSASCAKRGCGGSCDCCRSCGEKSENDGK